MKKAILVLNGKEFNSACFLQEYDQYFIVAVDGGINYLEKLDIELEVDLHIGDMDSFSHKPSSKITINKQIILPVEKDFSDYYVALEYLNKQKIEQIVVYGALGGRNDHFLANYYNSILFAKEMSIMIKSENEFFHFLNKSSKFTFPIGQTISIFSGTEKVNSLTLKGFKYELDNYLLFQKNPLGLSNITIQKNQEIIFSDGIIVIIYEPGKKIKSRGFL